MADLEDYFDESIRNEEEQRPVEEKKRAEEEEKTAIEAGRRMRGHRKKRVDELTYGSTIAVVL